MVCVSLLTRVGPSISNLVPAMPQISCLCVASRSRRGNHPIVHNFRFWVQPWGHVCLAAAMVCVQRVPACRRVAYFRGCVLASFVLSIPWLVVLSFVGGGGVAWNTVHRTARKSTFALCREKNLVSGPVPALYEKIECRALRVTTCLTVKVLFKFSCNMVPVYATAERYRVVRAGTSVGSLINTTGRLREYFLWA